MAIEIPEGWSAIRCSSHRARQTCQRIMGNGEFVALMVWLDKPRAKTVGPEHFYAVPTARIQELERVKGWRTWRLPAGPIAQPWITGQSPDLPDGFRSK